MLSETLLCGVTGFGFLRRRYVAGVAIEVPTVTNTYNLLFILWEDFSLL